MEKLKKAMEKRGFTVHTAADAAAARELVLSMLVEARTVGVGGSVTIQELDIVDTLRREGKEVFWHWLKDMDAAEARRRSIFSDCFLCSANAVTEDGKLLFIDGTGNRTAAVAYGPKRVILVIGSNKLAGDEEDALRRVRREGCTLNARRMGLKTPCGLGSECTDCSSPQRFCSIFVKLERCPKSHPVDIVLVDAPLGY